MCTFHLQNKNILRKYFIIKFIAVNIIYIYIYIYICFLYFIDLFIWLHWVLVAAHGLFAVACGLLSSCGVQALERAGSVVVAHRLSCSAACGILVP